METEHKKLTGSGILYRIILGLIVILLTIFCIFAWNITQIINRAGENIVQVTEDLKHVSGTTANISIQLDDVIGRMDRLEKKAKGVLRMDEAENILDELESLKTGAGIESVSQKPEAEKEIKYLLSQIKKSGMKFEYSGKVRSTGRFYLQMYAKYKSYKKTLTSTEDFIQKVGTKTIAGNQYDVLLQNGEKQPLSEWLSKKLEEYRAKHTVDD